MARRPRSWLKLVAGEEQLVRRYTSVADIPVSIDKPEISENLPNLAIMFSDRRQKIGYYTAKFWVDGDTVIIENSLSEPKYRLLDGHRAEELKQLIETYKVKIYTD